MLLMMGRPIRSHSLRVKIVTRALDWQTYVNANNSDRVYLALVVSDGSTVAKVKAYAKQMDGLLKEGNSVVIRNPLIRITSSSKVFR